MASSKNLQIALIFAQFAAYHVDRCEAVAERLAGRADVLAVEISNLSESHAWEQAGKVAGARLLTLFPGESYLTIPPWRRFWRTFRAVRRCDIILIGFGYNEPDMIALSWLLRLIGKRVIALSESKFDDRQRTVAFEVIKSLILACYEGAIVGGRRQLSYFQFLGFRRRPVLLGYDTVGVDRIRAMAGTALNSAAVPFASRPLVYVGRFVGKKNLVTLVEGYAAYAAAHGSSPRRLVLIGSGEDEAAIRSRAAELGVTDLIDFPGFLGAELVAKSLAGALALVLPSVEEQWGLVVNEALAVGVPVIVSTEVGARDVLVRNLLNGFVIEPGSAQGLAAAFATLGADEALWHRMAAASQARAWLGDTERLADAVELMLASGSEVTRGRYNEFAAEMGCDLLQDRYHNCLQLLGGPLR